MDTLEGTTENGIWYHYDINNDVLYMRLASKRDVETYGEETSDGFILLRADNDAIAGMTVVDYWRRFGAGSLQEASLHTLRISIAARAHALEYVQAA